MENRIRPKILLYHPTGNANVRAIADGFLKLGILDSFYTCIAIFRNTLSFKIFQIGILKEFQRRSFNADLKRFTRVRPLRELCRLISQKFGLKRYIENEVGIFSVDNIYRDLDRYVSKNLKNIDAIYAYEDGALESFRKAKLKGVKCFYELPTGYWRAHRKYLGGELLEKSDWSKTLNCFLNSSEKLARKDAEIALADSIIVASDFTKKTLDLYPGALPPVHVIPYGFPPVYKDRIYSSMGARKLKVLFVGGMTQLKGVANILEAFDEFKNSAELTLVGRKSFDKCAALERGLAEHTWIPSLPHKKVLELMREHDVLLFPSLFEGYGLVITEAMAQGTPVITTNRTCGANFIVDGQNGWMVEPGNTASIVNKLREVIENVDSLPDIGRAAMQSADGLPIETFGVRVARALEIHLQ
ncbi:glycosyltransferase [Gramella sp. BOM4]|nr:glycosyltransferase [Christiangramia bathymodioli]